METKNLSYNVAKYFVENGVTYKMNVRISLDDSCKNGVCNWSVTADIYEKRRNGRFVWCASNCLLIYICATITGNQCIPLKMAFTTLKTATKKRP
jgi:hypothetical protein